MKIGDRIALLAYGDEIIHRRVVAYSQRMVWICTDAEYEAAIAEAREPVTVGFRRADIADEVVDRNG